MSIDFVIVNDIQQYFATPGSPYKWIHHATIKRRSKEYIVFRETSSNSIYMEELETNRANVVFKLIEDDKEWADLYRFCKAAGLFNIAGEVKAADNSFLDGLCQLLKPSGGPSLLA